MESLQQKGKIKIQNNEKNKKRCQMVWDHFDTGNSDFYFAYIYAAESKV